MRALTMDECQNIGAGVDYFTWGQVGAGLGAVFGALYTLQGPMTGAALAFKPFEMVLKGAMGAGIGLGVAVAAGILYEVGSNAYSAATTAAEVGAKVGMLAVL